MEHIIAYVGTNLTLQGTLPAPLLPNASIRRASKTEIEDFDSKLNVLKSPVTSMRSPSYRHEYKAITEGPSTKYVPHLLPEALWRYWVVDFRGNGLDFDSLEKLLLLTNPSISLTYIRYHAIDGSLEAIRRISPHVLARVGEFASIISTPPTIDTAELSSLCAHIGFLGSPPDENDFARLAVHKFFDLQRLPPDSDMYLLGLFSIIESIIAHSPRLNESLDSINHQLVNKLHLIEENVIEKPALSTLFFGELPHATLWKKLYAVRSLIAHTAIRSLPAEHHSLRSKENIISYVELKTKELMRAALDNPKLLRHLKAC
jgi:hypothetical protein